MADRKAEFALQLTDEASGAADSVADALGNLRRSIEGDQRELAAMQKAMRNLQMGSVVNVDQFRKLKSAIDAKRQSVATAQAQYLNLGGTFARTANQGRGLEARFAALQKQVVGMPGPLGKLGGSLTRIGGLVTAGGAIAAGVIAIVAALAALVVASAAAVAALAKYGIAQADARRSELLRLEGLSKLRFFYQRMPGNAKEMQAGIDKVSSITALGREDLVKYNEQLYRMGLRGANLTKALEGVAIKAATQGDQAAQVFAGWAAGASLSGRSIDKLVDNVRARLGPIAAKQLLSLDVQTRKLKENFDAMFRDLNIEAFLGGLKVLTDLMSQSTASGKALKQILETILKPLIDDATSGAPLIKRFFQGMILAAQGVTIAILRMRIWLRDTFGDSRLLKNIDTMSIALGVGKVAAYGLAAGLGLAALALVSIGASLAMPYALLLGIGLLANQAWEALIDFGARVHKFFSETDWGALGKSIIDGIVEALTGVGVERLVTSLKNLGGVAIDAFKLALGISSPSKEFERLGLAIPQGVEVGVAAGTPSAREAVSEIAPVPSAPTAGPSTETEAPRTAAAAPARAGGGGRGPMNFYFGDINVNGGGDKSAAKDLAEDFKRQLAAVLEGIAIEIGAPVAGET